MQTTRPQTPKGWRNAHRVADDHARDIVHLESAAFAMMTSFRVVKSHPQSEFSILWHKDGHSEKLVAGNLTADAAKIRLEQLSAECGQPILRDLIVNESDEEGCGYYYVVEDLPEGIEEDRD